MKVTIAFVCPACLLFSVVYPASVIGATNGTTPANATDSTSSSCIKVCPEALQAVDIQSQSAVIEWKPRNLTSVTGYHLSYQSVCGSNDNLLVRGRGTSARNLDNLHPHTRYEVVANVLCNDSIPEINCDYLFFTTNSSAPARPGWVVADIRNSSVVQLSWQALDQCSWHGTPRHYNVYTLDLASGRAEVHQVPAHQTTVSIVPLPGRTMNASIAGVNHLGEGPRSDHASFVIPDVCEEFFFCNTYSYYVIAGGGVLVVAVVTTCLLLLCKKTCSRRKVTYCRGIRERQVGLSTIRSLDRTLTERHIDFNDFDSMTDINSEVNVGAMPEEKGEEVVEVAREERYRSPGVRVEPVYNNGWVYDNGGGPGPVVGQVVVDGQYATLDSIGKSSCSSLSSLSNDEDDAMEAHSKLSSLPRIREEGMSDQRGAYPYEVPSRKGSSELPHIYQSVDEAAEEVAAFQLHGNHRSRSVNTLPSSIPSSASTSRESSVEPRFATLGPKVGGDYSLPPLPEYSPPPLRRSTLDLMKKLHEESDHYGNSSQAVSSHYRAGGLGGSVPDILDGRSSFCLSDDSLANHGPTQTPPPSYTYEGSSSRSNWMKTVNI